MSVTISARTALGALCCFILGVPGSWAQSPPTRTTTVDMQAGQSYRSGTRVRVPNGVASFLIPTGWRGEQLDNLAAVLMVSEKEAGFVLAFAILNQTEDEIFALLGEPQPITETLVFEPAGNVTRNGKKLTATYSAGTLSGHGVAVMGPDLQGILFLHGRPQQEPRPRRSLLDELAGEVRFIPTKDSLPSP
jgi:hypothetical protein